MSTVEVEESFTELALSPYAISFLSDDIIRLRYVEIDGQLRKVLMVVKMRGSDHSKDMREYEITSEGLRHRRAPDGLPRPDHRRPRAVEHDAGAKLGPPGRDGRSAVGVLQWVEDRDQRRREPIPSTSSSLCRYLSERSPQPMVAVEGTTHVVIYFNPAFARLVGRDDGNLDRPPLRRGRAGGEENGCLALLDRVFRTGAPENLAEQEHRQTIRPVYWSYACGRSSGRTNGRRGS